MHNIGVIIPKQLALLVAASLLTSTAVFAGPGDQDRRDNAGQNSRYDQSKHNQQPQHQPAQQAQRAPVRVTSQPHMRPGSSVARLPSGYRQIHHRDHDYYYVRGGWYRPHGNGFIVVTPPIGLSIPVLPGGYISLMIGGRPYYRYNNIYYVQRGNNYVVVDAPSQSNVSTPAQDELFIYPTSNQSAGQQSKDKYECHQWGNSQTGYDPTQPYGGVAANAASATRANYQRAMTACLEARGYTVR
ncbi:MAG TPA: hypothetical protein ENH72_11300 [Pseudomonas sabulinigri]|uniref:Glycine zipper family protein n=1 Tax=marine sediment metagenome TaxID=412755 RepID=A0A0F9VSS3_9ZZZZ|nr:hypothetical protein [Halopseudomonas sabulinigri]HEC51196.1 hypothetical protein [Halopseudomonas sabulinigri]